MENRNAQPRQVGLEVQNTFINLNEQNSANVLLSVNIANQNFSADLEEYDGVDDFNGTSGRSYDDVTLDTADNIIYESLILNSNSFTDILDVAELENYIGDDLIIFPLSTSGDSNCSSSSNISCRIDTTAAAVVSIQYDFIPTEPPVEPPTEPNDPANPNTNPPILTTVRTGGQD